MHRHIVNAESEVADDVIGSYEANWKIVSSLRRNLGNNDSILPVILDLNKAKCIDGLSNGGRCGTCLAKIANLVDPAPYQRDCHGARRLRFFNPEAPPLDSFDKLLGSIKSFHVAGCVRIFADHVVPVSRGQNEMATIAGLIAVFHVRQSANGASALSNDRVIAFDKVWANVFYCSDMLTVEQSLELVRY